MSRMTTAQLRKNLADAVNEAAYAKQRTIITRRGKPFAALVPIEDLEAMEALEDLMDIKAAEASKRDAEKHGGTMRLDDFIRQLQEEG